MALLSREARRRHISVSRRRSLILGSILAWAALSVGAEGQTYDVYVSNERSGDVTVIDGATRCRGRDIFQSGNDPAESIPRLMESGFSSP